ncbi:ATPase, T2SS/T4P/T4SS family, partial [Microcoleus sp. herbarium12]|uniref:ATPase, T2SS/T4P/T4SS family n=1 Tax=Microcoleus sp. herbarium12 TaxID=3055437 RepID=UPI002FD4ACDC
MIEFDTGIQKAEDSWTQDFFLIKASGFQTNGSVRDVAAFNFINQVGVARAIALPTREKLMVHTSSTDSAATMDSDRIFQLIDTVVPFEACLYYQVLPLSLEGNLFKLGIVDAQDDSALDYVQRILAYMNCSVTTEQIASETQRSMLSAYLLHGNQVREPSLTETTAAPTPKNPAPPNSRSEADTLLSVPEPSIPARERLKPARAEVLLTPAELAVLDVEALHLSSPVQVLATLPAPQLLQELLGRVLLDGIGRLFFERHQSMGRILWSQDGVLKSILEGLSPVLFQEVIDELKRLTDMPVSPVEHPKQVEVERIYGKTHLLLRLRVMPVGGKEEATLQVLRGAALRFYQQQQLSTLSRDALRLAEELQRKVNQIRDRTRLSPLPLEGLPALEQVVRNVDDQLEALMQEH